MKKAVCLLALMLPAILAEGFRVGTGKAVITPPAGTPMAGYYSTRLSTGVHDDLYAKAIVVEAGGKKAALVACDLVALPAAVIEEARELIRVRTGIPAPQIMISATHSHTGPLIPDGGERAKAFGGEFESARAYRAQLPARIAESVERAHRALTPARISYGTGREDSISFNRRFFMKDGSVRFNPGRRNPDAVRPAGPIDPAVPVVYFESPQGQPLATYVNFALHLDTVGGPEASADYPYTLAKVLGQVKGGNMLTLFTIGAAGNINHIDVSSTAAQKGHAEAERIGTILAGEVIKTYARLKPVEATELRAASRTVLLEPAKLQPGDEEKARVIAKEVTAGKTVPFLDSVWAFKVLDTVERKGKLLEAEVQVIALGDQLAWVALPGEVFTELGQTIRRASPFAQTIVVELAHGPTTYFPDLAAHSQGHYEVVTSRAAPLAGEKMAEAAAQLLRELYRGQQAP